MSKVNLETFKKLLNVKRGGAEFFRFIIKFLVGIFILGALFYGLIGIPNQNLNLNITKANIEVLRVQRSCEANARATTMQIATAMKKDKKEFSKEQEMEFFIKGYNNCVFLQGMDFLAQRPTPAKKTAVQKK